MSRGRRWLPGDRRPNSHRTTPTQEGHRKRLQLFPNMGLRVLKCYCPSKKASQGTAESCWAILPARWPAAAERPSRWLVRLSKAARDGRATRLLLSRGLVHPGPSPRQAGGAGACWAQPSKPLHMGRRREPAAVPALLLPRCAFLGKPFSSLCLSVLVCKMETRQHLP